MRICLIGDYSAFHYNLKKGLNRLGCEVVLFSGGDGWKKIPTDVEIGSGIKGLSGRLLDQMWLPDFAKLKKLGQFDVVQFINPVIFPFNITYKFGSFFPNKKFIEQALSQADKAFLIAAGDDHFYTKECLNGGFRYEPLSDCLKIDKGSLIKQFFRYDWSSKVMYEMNSWMVNNVRSTIPIAYEYHQSYLNSGIKNITPVTPMPLDVTHINVTRNVSKFGRVVHGINKPGFKGTRHIKQAFDILSSQNQNFEFVTQGSLPLQSYIESLSKTAVVVDQVNSYSYAMNALYSLASGKIVISGAEPECLSANNVSSERFLINAIPEVKSIVNSVESAIQYSLDEKNYADQCRAYVEKYHDCKIIAEKFIHRWSDY